MFTAPGLGVNLLSWSWGLSAAGGGQEADSPLAFVAVKRCKQVPSKHRPTWQNYSAEPQRPGKIQSSPSEETRNPNNFPMLPFIQIGMSSEGKKKKEKKSNKSINTKTEDRERSRWHILHFTWIWAAAWKNKSVKAKVLPWALKTLQYREALKDSV